MDIREGRKYSELRISEILNYGNKRLYQCSECGRLFEEKSRFCPFCSRKGLPKKTMGEIKPIREE